MGRSRNSVGSAAIAAVGRPEAALRPFAGPGGVVVVPQVVRAAGPLAVDGTVEFFTARLPNPHTRAAYGRAVREFCTWCEECSVGLGQLSAPVVATYVQQLTLRVSPSSGNLHLSAVRQWLDWLTVRGALPFNPALSVRGAKVLRQEGKTPVLERDQTRVLFESLDGATDVVSLRDRAVLSVMLYAFVRAGALIQMKVQDFQVQGVQGGQSEHAWLCLREKGGQQRRVPAHHLLRSHVEAYLGAAQFGSSPAGRRAPLFQSAPGGRRLSGRPLDRVAVRCIVKRRCLAVGLPPSICSHSLRATGITLHQENGGSLDDAARLAGHADTRTTLLYCRRPRPLAQADVEKVFF